MFDLNELKLIRTALDVITIKGSDAQYLSHLQLKIEKKLEPPKPKKTGS
jgi:hypothetical protein